MKSWKRKARKHMIIGFDTGLGALVTREMVETYLKAQANPDCLKCLGMGRRGVNVTFKYVHVCRCVQRCPTCGRN